MALSKFNKFLVLKGYAKQASPGSDSIVLNGMLDSKKVNKEFRDNANNLRKYYAMKNGPNANSFGFMTLKSNLIFC